MTLCSGALVQSAYESLTRSTELTKSAAGKFWAEKQENYGTG
jgi:hypothetical protein